MRVELESLHACQKLLEAGVRPIATTRDSRFLGKVAEATARCRGGDYAAGFRATPWTDWGNYWAAGDLSSKAPDFARQAGHAAPNERGVDGALVDLEYERIELIKFNLFDNNKTYEAYVTGRKGVGGAALKTWPQMRLPAAHPEYANVGGEAEQVCRGELLRRRTLTGICNDIRSWDRPASYLPATSNFPPLSRIWAPTNWPKTATAIVSVCSSPIRS